MIYDSLGPSYIHHCRYYQWRIWQQEQTACCVCLMRLCYCGKFRSAYFWLQSLCWLCVLHWIAYCLSLWHIAHVRANRRVCSCWHFWNLNIVWKWSIQSPPNVPRTHLITDAFFFSRLAVMLLCFCFSGVVLSAHRASLKAMSPFESISTFWSISWAKLYVRNRLMVSWLSQEFSSSNHSFFHFIVKVRKQRLCLMPRLQFFPPSLSAMRLSSTLGRTHPCFF